MTQEAQGKTKTISFSLSMNYGAATVNFQTSTEITVSSWGDEMRETEKLIAQVWSKHDEFAKSHLHKLPAPPAPRSDSDYKKPEAFLENVACESASVTIDDGKRYIKIKGGKYTKHGVVIWDEVLKTTDILTRLGTATTLDMRGYTMVVDTSGKPKVVKVIPPHGT